MGNRPVMMGPYTDSLLIRALGVAFVRHMRKFAVDEERTVKLRSVWTAGTLALSIGGATTSTSQQVAPETPPGEGVICTWAIYSLVEEVGRRCAPGRYPEVQAELRRTVQRLDDYVRANSDITPEEIARFKSEQAHVGAPEAELCQGDPLMMFEHVSTIDSVELRTGIDAMTARPGQPTWGTCL